jgi:hypothetical protein
MNLKQDAEDPEAMPVIAKGLLVERSKGTAVEHELRKWRTDRDGAPHHIPTANQMKLMDDSVAFISIYLDRTFDIWTTGKGSLEKDELKAKIEELDGRIKFRSID